MDRDVFRRRARHLPPSLVGGLGAALTVAAVNHHYAELEELSWWLPGPLLAAVLDTLPPLALVYAGYWLARSDLDAENRWAVCTSTVGVSVVFLTVMWATIAVRRMEGRAVGEPAFPLLVAAGCGGVAGFAVGYYNARARRSRTVAEAFAFVNSFIRHDLRNDLSVIQGHADLLDAGQSETDAPARPDSAAIIGEKVDEAMTRIETSCVVAETLADEPDLGRVDLATAATEMADRNEAAHGVPVTTDVPEQAPVVANAGVRSVVDNLVENAVEHNDADDPRVHVAVERGVDTVRLRVLDNGSSIAAERQTRMFDDGDSREGGLRLVEALVDGYDGTVCVEDNEPRGTVFVVELEAADAAPGGSEQ